MTTTTPWLAAWDVLPEPTPVRRGHDCRGDRCRSCGAAIEAAEYERDYGDHGAEADDAAERWVR